MVPVPVPLSIARTQHVKEVAIIAILTARVNKEIPSKLAEYQIGIFVLL